MKKVLLLTGAAMIVASAAFAQGINLHWDDCTLGAPNLDKVDNCLTFGAPPKMVISVGGAPANTVTQVNGAQGIIDVQSEAAALPDFWRMDAGGCRAGVLSADVTVGSATAPFSCPEPWSPNIGGPGGQAGGASFIPFVGGPNRGRINWLVAIPGTNTIDFNIAPDWYLIAINMLKAGSNTCAGCTTPACLVANEIRLTKPAGTVPGDVFMNNPASSQHITWFGAGLTFQCPGATPNKSQTWGQVKSLYR